MAKKQNPFRFPEGGPDDDDQGDADLDGAYATDVKEKDAFAARTEKMLKKGKGGDCKHIDDIRERKIDAGNNIIATFSDAERLVALELFIRFEKASDGDCAVTLVEMELLRRSVIAPQYCRLLPFARYLATLFADE